MNSTTKIAKICYLIETLYARATMYERRYYSAYTRLDADLVEIQLLKYKNALSRAYDLYHYLKSQ